eukprot:ANDGO_07470.mRNA.1 hypothetical protein
MDDDIDVYGGRESPVIFSSGDTRSKTSTTQGQIVNHSFPTQSSAAFMNSGFSGSSGQRMPSTLPSTPQAPLLTIQPPSALISRNAHGVPLTSTPSSSSANPFSKTVFEHSIILSGVEQVKIGLQASRTVSSLIAALPLSASGPSKKFGSAWVFEISPKSFRLWDDDPSLRALDSRRHLALSENDVALCHDAESNKTRVVVVTAAISLNLANISGSSSSSASIPLAFFFAKSWTVCGRVLSGLSFLKKLNVAQASQLTFHYSEPDAGSLEEKERVQRSGLGAGNTNTPSQFSSLSSARLSSRDREEFESTLANFDAKKRKTDGVTPSYQSVIPALVFHAKPASQRATVSGSGKTVIVRYKYAGESDSDYRILKRVVPHHHTSIKASELRSWLFADCISGAMVDALRVFESCEDELGWVRLHDTDSIECTGSLVKVQVLLEKFGSQATMGVSDSASAATEIVDDERNG